MFRCEGFWISFLASSMISLLVVLYCLVMIRNDSVITNKVIKPHLITTKPKEIKGNDKKDCYAPFIDFLRKMASACFRQRHGKLRMIMGLLLCSKMIGYAGQMMVEGNILFLDAEESFGWSFETYSTWFGVYNISVFIGVIIIGPILNKFFSNPLQSYIGNLINGIFYFLVAMSNETRR